MAAVVLCCCGVGPVRAELLDVSATLDCSVIQYIGQTVEQVAHEQMDVSAGEAGSVVAAVDRLLGDPELTFANGRSEVYFADPFNPVVQDPIVSFGGELLTYSTDLDVYQVLLGDAFESRTIMVTEAEAEVPDGTMTVVTGELFLHGVMVAWAPEGTDLTGMEALLGFEIELVRENGGSSFVLSGALQLLGGADNQVVADNAGALADFDPATVVWSGDYEELGLVHVEFFPQVLLPYVYEVTVGETYELTARLRLKVQGLPSGVGVGLSAGESFVHLAEVVNEMTDTAVGDGLQQRIANELGSFSVVQPPGSILELADETCGATGAEGAALLGIVSVAGLTTFRRRRTF